MNTKYTSWIMIAVVAVLLGAMASADAQTIAYYRFEDDPGFLIDSGPNGYDLSNASSWPQVATPFPNPVPQTGQADAKAVDVPNAGYAMVGTTSNATQDVTAEAFINSDSFGGNVWV